MSRITTNVVTTVLLGAGAAAWALAGRPLTSDAELDVPLNPMGINGSPYGEVFAMAMQGPIDTHFHGVLGGGSGHQHAPGDTCDSCGDASSKDKSSSTTHGGLNGVLASLEKAVETRTNPKAASEAHKKFLRRQVEDKLRFAYQLDPAHYANYNSLHFFLTEPQLGTRPELTPSAAKLAEDTIQYCLKKDDDPRPALTAAAAASNILELMFNDQQKPSPKFKTTQMRQHLNLLDHCIGRYMTIARKWDETRNWELLSPQRIQECDDRIQYILKFREAAEGAIARFEGKPHPSQVAN
jgi:hypothetical protein